MDSILLYIQKQSPATDLLCLLCFVFMMLFWIRTRIGKSNGQIKSTIPRVFSWIWLGNIDVLKELPHIALTNLSKKYGPVYMISLGWNKTFVIVSDNDQIREAAGRFPIAFSGKPQSTTTVLATQGCHRDQGKRWQKRRNIMMKSIKTLFTTSDQMIKEIYNSELAILVKTIKLHSEMPYNPRSEIKHFIARTMWRMVFGHGLQPDAETDSKLLEIAHKIDHYSSNAGVFSLLNRFPTIQKYLSTAMKNYKDFSMTLDSFVDRENSKRRLSCGLTHDTPCDIFDLVSNATKELTEKDEKCYGLTEDLVLKGLGDFIRSGTEAPSITVEWLLLILAKFPGIQEKMTEELEMFRQNTLINTDTTICELTSQTIPYTEAVFYEGLRFTSAAPFAKRLTLGDMKIGGHFIPQGSTIILNNHAMNHSQEKWDRPDLFNPERFLHQDGSFDNGALNNFIPFGVGRRRCFGENLGKITTIAAIATIIANFRVTPCEDHEINLRPLSGMTLSPTFQNVVFTQR